MDAVTYPHPDVKNELSRWIERRADIVAERDLASAFGVSAVPTAVLLDHEGRVLDRVVGFVQPESFRSRLSSARGDLPAVESR